MTDDGATTTETAALTARIAELERENARLSTPPPVRRRGRWRAILSAVCIVVAAILVPVSVVAAWSRGELVDPERFVATVGPLADDPAVQQLVIDETMSAIEEKVDFAALTGNVISGITELGLPPRAADALTLLQQPAAQGLQNLVQGAVTRVVESDAFADVWRAAAGGAHAALTATATSDGGGIVVLTDQGLGIRLGPIVAQVSQRLVDQGVGVARLIPAIDKTVIVGTGDSVSTVRVVYALAVSLGWWIPVIALAILIAGILTARRRSVAVIGSGIALVLGAAVTLVALSAGGVAVGVAADQLRLSPAALDSVYRTLTADMTHTATILIVLGVLLAVLGWALGSGRSARRFRGVVASLNASARAGLARRGLDTGAFGRFLAQFRTAIRVAVIVLAVVWLFALRPLSFGDIVLVLVTAIVVTWLLELLQRRPEEHDEAPATEEPAAA